MNFLEHLGIEFADPSAVERPGSDAGLRVVPAEEHANDSGAVHGGLIATLIDATMGRAVKDTLEEGQSTATVTLTITYLKPGKVGTELVSSAEVRKRGKELVMCEVDVKGDGEDIAHGVGTFAITG